VRQEALVQLFLKTGNRCLQGHKVCPIIDHYLIYKGEQVSVAIEVDTDIYDRNHNPVYENGKRKTMKGWKVVARLIEHRDFTNLYETLSEQAITDWQADDRAEAKALWQKEQRRLHKMPDERGWRRQFDPVAREQFMEQRGVYHVEAVSVNPLTHQRVARVRVSGTNVRLYVNIQRQGRSNGAKKRALRRAAQGVASVNDRLIKQAVERFWQSRT
jgi:hypothetical protein